MAPSLPGYADIPNKVLVEEIKKNPLLYDRNAPGYSSHDKKREAWHQISSVVFPEQWPKWSKSERVESIAGLQKRWGNLRTCFIKCYKQFLIKKQQGLAEDDRIRYRHFNKMAFLIPFLSLRPPSLDTNKIVVQALQDTDSDDESQDWSVHNDEQYLEDDSTNEDVHVVDEELDQTPAKKIKREYYEDMSVEVPIDPLNVPRSHREEALLMVNKGGTDQDMNFAMSLVPMFRELPLAKKLQAQIEILQVFQNITKGSK